MPFRKKPQNWKRAPKPEPPFGGMGNKKKPGLVKKGKGQNSANKRSKKKTH